MDLAKLEQQPQYGESPLTKAREQLSRMSAMVDAALATRPEWREQRQEVPKAEMPPKPQNTP